MKIVYSLLIVCVIATSLINSSYFGNVSLAAYFGFCISTAIASIIICFHVFLSYRAPLAKSFPYFEPTYIFLALTAYIIGYGFVTDTFNLSQYYWLAAAAILLSIKGLTIWAPEGPGRKDILHTSGITQLHLGIIFIAVLESVLVIFQWLGLTASMNEMFACTGTWVNPNVTAIFLALSLFSQIQIQKSKYGKTLFTTQISIILLAITLLQCRTAYIVAVILLLVLYKSAILNNFKSSVVKSTSIVLFILLLAFGFKTNSTEGRIQIWKNTSQLISSKPIWGVGFGNFEREYNLFVTQHNLPSNDHVNMPYNDFIELAVEGGLIAVLLWIVYLLFLIQRVRKTNGGVALVICFIIIQLTNFGFQAIPVFVLFLIYVGCLLAGSEKKSYSKSKPVVSYLLKPVLAVALLLQLYVATTLFSIANAFHQSKLISGAYSLPEAIEAYRALAGKLDFASNYHESFGDLFMETGNFGAAKTQYRQALQNTSRPVVLGKCGWCYGQLSQYDSATYYFEMIEKLQPYKYAPRMALLKLYELKKDTVSITSKAREIIAMPVKVPSAEVDRIKSEAVKWLHTESKNSR